MAATAQPRRTAPAFAATLLLFLVAACGPDPAEIDRGPVAGTTEEDASGGGLPEGARTNGTVSVGLAGESAPSGDAVVQCGPFDSDEAPSGRSGMAIVVLPRNEEGTRVVLRIADYRGAGEYDAALTVERTAEDGSSLQSRGTARVAVEEGDLLDSDTATHSLGGRFAGSFQGGAGVGDATGSFASCLYFE